MLVKNINKRIPAFDGIRVLATLSVFVFHCVHVFDPMWFHVNNRDTGMGYMLVTLFMFLWIMPLFFLVAGFSAQYSIGKRTSGAYIKERFIRLIIPMLFGIPLLTYPQMLVEGLHHGFFPTGSFSEVMHHWGGRFSDWRVFLTPGIFGNLGHHLWFLGFLFLYSLLFQPLFRWVLNNREHPVVVRILTFFRKPSRLLLLIVPVSLAYGLMRPINSGYSEWTDFLYWSFFYLVGFLIAINEELRNRLKKSIVLFGVIGLLSFAGMLIVCALTQLVYYDNPDYSPLSLLNHFFWAGSGLTLSLLIVSIGLRFFTKPVNKTLQSRLMPFYLLHQPIILVLAYFIVQPEWSMHLKFLLLLTSSFVVTSLLAVVSPRIPFIKVMLGQWSPKVIRRQPEPAV